MARTKDLYVRGMHDEAGSSQSAYSLLLHLIASSIMHNMPDAACYLAGCLLPVKPLACWMLSHGFLSFALLLLPAGATCIIYNTAYFLNAQEAYTIRPMSHLQKELCLQVLVVHTYSHPLYAQPQGLTRACSPVACCSFAKLCKSPCWA